MRIWNKQFKWVALLGMVVLASCDFSTEGYYSTFSLSYDFKDSDWGWVGDFADYPEGDSIAYELEFKHTVLPEKLDANKKALKISGNNGSDDLFMFVKKKLSGLRPNTSYVILFNVRLASSAPTGVGVGGSPGESVFLKVGATVSEPKKILLDGMYQMNIDKGNQAEEGENMINVGHIGVAASTTDFTIITRNNNSSKPFFVRTNPTGELWLIIGTDSGYEGKTTLYYTSVDVLFNEL
jgi:hypothetical protein